MRQVLAIIAITLGLAAVAVAQNRQVANISAVAAAGAVSSNQYTNSYFKMSVDAPNATLQLNPVLDVKGQYARLLQVDSAHLSWEETYAFAVTADSLTINPQVKSAAQYVRSIRHKLEKDGLPTVRQEFPITIAGAQFTGAVLEQQAQGQKYYRGIFSSFRNGYVLTFDVEAATPERLNKLVTGAVKFLN